MHYTPTSDLAWRELVPLAKVLCERIIPTQLTGCTAIITHLLGKEVASEQLYSGLQISFSRYPPHSVPVSGMDSLFSHAVVAHVGAGLLRGFIQRLHRTVQRIGDKVCSSPWLESYCIMSFAYV
ncbi:hypothetical protein XPA_000797 [Xanthoria parietina]